MFYFLYYFAFFFSKIPNSKNNGPKYNPCELNILKEYLTKLFLNFYLLLSYFLKEMCFSEQLVADAVKIDFLLEHDGEICMCITIKEKLYFCLKHEL